MQLKHLQVHAGMTVPYENHSQIKSKPSGLVEKAVRFYQANLNERMHQKLSSILRKERLQAPQPRNLILDMRKINGMDFSII